jgi:hypothetical protein
LTNEGGTEATPHNLNYSSGAQYGRHEGASRQRAAAKEMKENSINKEAADQLHNAIEQLRHDVRRVEVWATAVSCFAQPVPEYSPAAEFLLPAKSGENSTDEC